MKRHVKIVSFALALMMCLSLSPKVNAVSDVAITENYKVMSNNFVISVKPSALVSKITGMSIDGKKGTLVISDLFVLGNHTNFYLNKDEGYITINEPDKDVNIDIFFNDGTNAQLKFYKNKPKGSRIELVGSINSNPSTDPSKPEDHHNKPEDHPSTPSQPTENKTFTLKDDTFLGEFLLKVEPKEAAKQVNKLFVDTKEQARVDSKFAIWRVDESYCIDDEGKVYIKEPNDGAEFKFVLKNGTEYKFKYQKSNPKGKRLVLQNNVVNKPEQPSVEPTPVQPSSDHNNVSLAIMDDYYINDFFLRFKDKKQAKLIKDLKINHVSCPKKDNKWIVFNGGYFIDQEKGLIYLNEPKDNDLITLVGDANQAWHFVYHRNKQKGMRLTVATNDQAKEKKIKIRLVGEFEAAIINQQKYDAISGSSLSISTNKNSNAKVQFAEVVDEKEVPKEKDWQDLCTRPELSKGWTNRKVELDPASGMQGVYSSISSAVTLEGVPVKAGKYQIKVSAIDQNGHKIESNTLPFNVYSQYEKLVDHMILANARQMKDKKYIWTMEPWFIQEFNGGNEQVVVPKDMKAIYGSHTTGTYGELGKPSTKGTFQTLILEDGTDLTLVNMKVKSSVKIIVKKGAKLNLRESVIFGEVVVEDGGIFAMNYDGRSKKYITGSSISGKLVLQDGAMLGPSMIYSNTNFITDADKSVEAVNNDSPIVEVVGKAKLLGNVFIKGDEAATGINPKTNKPYTGQPAMIIKNGELSVPKDVTLGLYGGGWTATTTQGGSALLLDNGKISGEGNLIAVGGSSFIAGKAGDAVHGKGTIAVAKAILNGGHSYGHEAIGKAYTEDVVISDKTIGKAVDGKFLHISQDDDQPLYWKTITKEPNIANVSYGIQLIKASSAPVEKTYQLEYKFNSATKDKELPVQVMQLLPLTKKNLPKGTVVKSAELANTSVVVEGGKWIFKGFAKDKVTIQDKDEVIVGTWEFKEVQAWSMTNNIPNLVVKNAEIKVGETLDLYSLIQRADDKEDGPQLNKQVVIDKGQFDATKAGEYVIKYRLTDKQKASVEKEAVVVVKEDKPRLLSVHGEKHILKTGVDFIMRSSSKIDNFIKLLVDDKEVDRQNYTLKSGSTIVSLKASYLNTLSVGKHNVTIMSKDGNVSSSVEILANNQPNPSPRVEPNPSSNNNHQTDHEQVANTSDKINLYLSLSLLTISLLALVIIRKKQFNR